MAEESSTPRIRLWYWKIPGRASLAHVLLTVGGISHEYIDEDNEPEKEKYKEIAPFGQLPCLIDRETGITMAQSAAVAAYAARVSKLDGGADDLATYAQVLQYLELEQELTQFIGRALYTGEKGSPERAAAFEDAKKKIDVKLERVQRNLGENSWITPQGPSAADYSVATVLWLVSLPALWPDTRTQFPKLNDHFNRLLAHSPAAAATFAEMEQWEQYYTRQ